MTMTVGKDEEQIKIRAHGIEVQEVESFKY